MNILVCDIDRSFGEFLIHVCTVKGHTCTHIATFDTLEDCLQQKVRYDFLLIDPTGISEASSLLRRVTSLNDETVIIYMQEAMLLPSKEIELLRLGVTCAIQKYFHLELLVAKLEALYSLYERRPPEILCKIGPFEFDWRRNMVKVYGKNREVILTKIESRILQILLENINQAVTYAAIGHYVYGYSEDDSGLLKSHIRNLRQKLEKDPSLPEYISTIRGVGYSFICTDVDINSIESLSVVDLVPTT